MSAGASLFSSCEEFVLNSSSVFSIDSSSSSISFTILFKALFLFLAESKDRLLDFVLYSDVSNFLKLSVVGSNSYESRLIILVFGILFVLFLGNLFPNFSSVSLSFDESYVAFSAINRCILFISPRCNKLLMCTLRYSLQISSTEAGKGLSP